MKKKHLALVILLLLSVFLLLSVMVIYLMLAFIDSAYWTKASQKISPSKEYLLSEYRYQSDYDHHAPYGTYLFLKKNNLFRQTGKGYIIFAGYCEKKFTYQWSENQNIIIICASNETDFIRTVVQKAYGIRVNIHTSGSP